MGMGGIGPFDLKVMVYSPKIRKGLPTRKLCGCVVQLLGGFARS